MTHKVSFTLPDRDLGNADIRFIVRSNRKVLGKLLVSKGAVVWRPKSKKSGKKLGWKQFDEMMKQQGKKE